MTWIGGRNMLWLLTRALRPVRTTTVRDLRIAMRCDTWMSRYRFLHPHREPETLDWIDRWKIRDGIFFDIGANVGLYSLYAALRHPEWRIVAFEPEASNFHYLRENVAFHQLRHVGVYPLALSNHDGLSELHLSHREAGSARHTESSTPIALTKSGQAVVWRQGTVAWTVDRFCEASGLLPTAIKLDVDGNEDEVLEGMKATLRSPGLQSLLVEDPSDAAARGRCERLLQDAGFAPVFSGQVNRIWERRTEDGT